MPNTFKRLLNHLNFIDSKLKAYLKEIEDAHNNYITSHSQPSEQKRCLQQLSKAYEDGGSFFIELIKFKNLIWEDLHIEEDTPLEFALGIQSLSKFNSAETALSLFALNWKELQGNLRLSANWGLWMFSAAMNLKHCADQIVVNESSFLLEELFMEDWVNEPIKIPDQDKRAKKTSNKSRMKKSTTSKMRPTGNIRNKESRTKVKEPEVFRNERNTNTVDQSPTSIQSAQLIRSKVIHKQLKQQLLPPVAGDMVHYKNIKGFLHQMKDSLINAATGYEFLLQCLDSLDLNLIPQMTASLVLDLHSCMEEPIAALFYIQHQKYPKLHHLKYNTTNAGHWKQLTKKTRAVMKENAIGTLIYRYPNSFEKEPDIKKQAGALITRAHELLKEPKKAPEYAIALKEFYKANMKAIEQLVVSITKTDLPSMGRTDIGYQTKNYKLRENQKYSNILNSIIKILQGIQINQLPDTVQVYLKDAIYNVESLKVLARYEISSPSLKPLILRDTIVRAQTAIELLLILATYEDGKMPIVTHHLTEYFQHLPSYITSELNAFYLGESSRYPRLRITLSKGLSNWVKKMIVQRKKANKDAEMQNGFSVVEKSNAKTAGTKKTSKPHTIDLVIREGIHLISELSEIITSKLSK